MDIRDISKALIIIDDLEIKRAVKAIDMLSVIWKLKEVLRKKLKYEELSDKEVEIYEDFQEILNESLYDNGINLDELYS